MKAKNIFAGAFCAGLAVAGAIVIAPEVSAADGYVTISDPVLGEALSDAGAFVSKKDDGQYYAYYPDEVSSISFNCMEGNPLAGVKDWSGMALFENLQYLDLCELDGVDWSQINDSLLRLRAIPYYRLFEFAKMSTLDEHDSDFDEKFMNNLSTHIGTLGESTDMSWISRFKELYYLDIRAIPVKNLNYIKDLPELQMLRLFLTDLEDISGIENTSINIVDSQLNQIRNPEKLVEQWDNISSQPGEYVSLFSNMSSSIAPQYITVELDDYTASAPDFIFDFPQMLVDIENKAVSGSDIEGGSTKGPSDNDGSDTTYTPDDFVTTNGVTISYDNRTITVDSTVSNPNITIYLDGYNYGRQVFYQINFTVKEDNPNTFDSSIAYLLGEISATTLAGFGILNVIKNRR